MKRKDGYYWVRLNNYNGLCWVCALYREIRTTGFWYMPGMVAPITDEGLFDFICADPIPAPNQPNTLIWTPEKQ